MKARIFVRGGNRTQVAPSTPPARSTPRTLPANDSYTLLLYNQIYYTIMCIFFVEIYCLRSFSVFIKRKANF